MQDSGEVLPLAGDGVGRRAGGGVAVRAGVQQRCVHREKA
jgi:hypothetical protein